MAAVLLPACSGGAVSPPRDARTNLSVSGSVLGVPFVAEDVAFQTNGSPPAGTYPSLELAMTDYAGACSADARRAASNVLRIYIYNEQDQTAIGPGTYTYLVNAAGAKFGTAVLHRADDAADASCASLSDLWAVAATITLTEVSAARVVGSFDTTIGGDGMDAGARDTGVGHVSGPFIAPSCPNPEGSATGCF